MGLSKSRVDRAGTILSKESGHKDEVDFIEMEEAFDAYRQTHLKPLSETTLELQRMLSSYGSEYYIAQRLKRKPQILRKLKRLSVRLTQLQDIGGCRIIVPKNADVDQIQKYLISQAEKNAGFVIERVTDYRPAGRDDTGYRSLHLIMAREGVKLELQVRSRIQHYWAESIERTSVIYKKHLKEKEGAAEVIGYFKRLSDVFNEIEAGRDPTLQQKLDLERLRIASEEIIARVDNAGVRHSYVNEDIIKTLVERENRNPGGLNNWILIFDWNQGAFVSWDIVGRGAAEAVASYVRYENQYPSSEGFEVVLIGSSEISTVSKTHSHYFGIDRFDSILESLDTSIVGFAGKMDIDVGARQILATLHRRHFWGRKTVSEDTLKNHFCKSIITFESSLESLLSKGYLIRSNLNGGFSLNISRKPDIDRYLI